MPLIAAEKPVEGPIDPFLGGAKFEIQKVFTGGVSGKRGGGRLPNVVVATDGTVLATHGATGGPGDWWKKGLQVRRSEDGGKTWSEPITIANPGWQGGGLTVDETRGDVLAFVEDKYVGNDPNGIKPTIYRSADHGKTWKGLAICEGLPDGPLGKGTNGCHAGLVRLPVRGRDIILYSNCGSTTSQRRNVTVWASFDGAKTWPIKRSVYSGPSAYSSLAAGRPATPSEGWVCILLEGGEDYRHEGAYLARFNLSWLLAGEKTGDGELPQWISQTTAGESTVNLAAVRPLQQTGEVSIDRSPEKGPLDLGDVVYATGVGVRAGSELTYDVSNRAGRFEAWAGIDPNVSAQRSGRFYIYADGELVFDSGVVNQTDKRGSTQNPTRPIRVVVPLAGVEKLRLTFQCEDDKDKAGLCGGWGDARFVPASAPEYKFGTYQGLRSSPVA